MKKIDIEKLGVESLGMDGYGVLERIRSAYGTARGFIASEEGLYPPGIRNEDYHSLYEFDALSRNGYLAVYGASYDGTDGTLAVSFHRRDDRIRRGFTLARFNEGPEASGRELAGACITQYLKEQREKAGELLRQEEALRRERLSITERALAIRRRYEDDGIIAAE